MIKSMSETNETVLDYINNITVPGKVFVQPANEYWALLCLRHGLEYLYKQAARCDEIVEQQLNPDGNLRVAIIGNHPALARVNQGLLTCAFHWYAVSACQYVQTVGAIAYRQDKTRPMPKDYTEAIIPEVLVFRNKVAAHFAWSSQNKRNDDAEQFTSIIPPLAFDDDSFHVGTFSTTIQSEEKVSRDETTQPWSICKVHERLRMRYWPEIDVSSEQLQP